MQMNRSFVGTGASMHMQTSSWLDMQVALSVGRRCETIPMDGGLLNGKVFRYVHHYMSEEVFGCLGVSK